VQPRVFCGDLRGVGELTVGFGGAESTSRILIIFSLSHCGIQVAGREA
jgi:hypothetical protein